MTMEELKEKLDRAIKEFNRNRARLLKMAFAEGGQDAVKRLEDNYDKMRKEYFKLLQAQLDQNAPAYQQLTADAEREAGKLEESLKQMQKATDILNLLSSVAEKLGKLAVLV